MYGIWYCTKYGSCDHEHEKKFLGAHSLEWKVK